MFTPSVVLYDRNTGIANSVVAVGFFPRRDGGLVEAVGAVGAVDPVEPSVTPVETVELVGRVELLESSEPEPTSAAPAPTPHNTMMVKNTQNAARRRFFRFASRSDTAVTLRYSSDNL
jgi:hypothetical protein